MGKIEEAKSVYKEIEIPAELSQRVNSTIEKYRIVYENQKKQQGGKSYRQWIIPGTAAAAAIVFVAGLNTSSAFAAAAGRIPVIGSVAKVLTFRSYDSADEDKTVHESVPGVVIESATVEEKAFTEEINAKIQEKCDSYLDGAIERVKEYKEAFLATGGTEQEFEEKNIVIEVDYEIKSQTDEVLSFVVEGTENWVAAYAMTDYYNLDLSNLEYLTLKDVLGEDYVTIANQSIKEQIQQREAADSNAVFWTEAEGGFVSVNEDTQFYVNEAGIPVIVFDKYEVAPGAMGRVEFPIALSGQSPNATEQNTADGAGVQLSDGSTDVSDEYRAFAEQIQDAFENEDLEALAKLVAYPVYIGIGDGIIVENKTEILELKPKEVFTPDIKKSIAEADLNHLEMFQSGVTIGEKGSVTFNETEEGTYQITGINY